MSCVSPGLICPRFRRCCVVGGNDSYVSDFSFARELNVLQPVRESAAVAAAREIKSLALFVFMVRADRSTPFDKRMFRRFEKPSGAQPAEFRRFALPLCDRDVIALRLADVNLPRTIDPTLGVGR